VPPLPHLPPDCQAANNLIKEMTMTPNKPFDATSRIADSAAQSAEHALDSTRRVANEMLDSLSGSVEDIRNQAVPAMNRAADHASSLAHRGMDAVRETSRHWREEAQHASDRTVNYIREEPVKSMLIAASAGAVLMALASLVYRSRHSD